MAVDQLQKVGIE